MRRGAFILILCLLMLGAGAYCVMLGAPAVPNGSMLRANYVMGTVLFLCAGIAGLIGMVSTRHAASGLARRLGELRGTWPPPHVDSPHPDFSQLAAAINGLIDGAAQSVARSQLDAKELDIQLKVVTAERQYLEAIIYSISDAVLVTDPFDEVVLANDAAARTFNFDLEHAGRSAIGQVLNDAKMIGLIRDMRQSDSRNARRIVEHSITGPGGERSYKVTLSCISSQGEQAAGVVAVLHDMTREKEVAQMKSEFVSSVSHELRTPLASIKAYAEMLIDGEAADEKTAHEFYDVIQNEANRLGRLIDNILNISRIESGVVKVNKRPQSLTVILKEAVEVILPQAKQKQITVEEENVPALYQVLADRDMLYEAVLNLLSNAVKYTPENGRVSIRTAVDESKKTVTLRISDTGVGIPPKDLPFIFDKFYRSEANSRMAKGTGLGLSLVKHIIETVHHGRVFVESQVGQGSTFGFELSLSE